MNVQDNNIGNIKGNKVVSDNKILSSNKIKVLSDNDNNKIGKVKDVNLLSKNYNKFLNDNKIKVGNVLCENHLYTKVLTDNDANKVKIPILSDNYIKGFKILSNNFKKGCGC